MSAHSEQLSALKELVAERKRLQIKVGVLKEQVKDLLTENASLQLSLRVVQYGVYACEHGHAYRNVCRRGHEFTEENTQIEIRGKNRIRRCRTCSRLRSARYRVRRRGQTRAAEISSAPIPATQSNV